MIEVVRQSDLIKIGKRFKAAREAAGLSIKQAAKLSQIYNTYIDDVEKGVRPHTELMVSVLGGTYKVKQAFLRGEKVEVDLDENTYNKLMELPAKDFEKTIQYISMLELSKDPNRE